MEFLETWGDFELCQDTCIHSIHGVNVLLKPCAMILNCIQVGIFDPNLPYIFESSLLGCKIANEDAKIITGCIKEDDNIGDLRVTIIATGFAQSKSSESTSMEASFEDQSSIGSQSHAGMPGTNINNDTIPQVNVNNQEDQTSLDIPAFLRQQAD